MEFVKLSPKHDDLVTDISFDFYGKRFASCSIDKNIKVWTLNNESSQWSCSEIPRAHQDSIWRLSWAHPEFGQLIASCSEDRTVSIWEEQEAITVQAIESTKDCWLKRASLSDSKRSVNDVKFAPRHMGLKIATASADGLIRMYEATDVFTLTYWQMTDFFRVEDTTEVLPDITANYNLSEHGFSEHGLTCLSWSDCPFEAPRIAVGGYSKRAVIWSYLNSKWIEVLILYHFLICSIIYFY